MYCIGRHGIDADRMTSIIASGTDLLSEGRPIRLKRFTQFASELAQVRFKKAAQSVRDRFDPPVLHVFRYRLLEQVQFLNRDLAEIKNDALCGSADHDSGRFKQASDVTFKPFCQIGHRNRLKSCDGSEMPKITGLIRRVACDILECLPPAFSQMKERRIGI